MVKRKLSNEQPRGTNRRVPASSIPQKATPAVSATAIINELFVKDGIDITYDNRDYFAEAFVSHMDANMPPILNRLKLEISLIDILDELVGKVQQLPSNRDKSYGSNSNSNNERKEVTVERKVQRTASASSSRRSTSTRRIGGRNND